MTEKQALNTAFATLEDLSTLWRPLKPIETERAEALLSVISDILRFEAEKVKKDLDKQVAESPTYSSVLKSVVVDIVGRTLQTSTEGEPLSQESQSANGYVWSGTYLNAGGGIFIKDSELKRLGLKKQRYGGIELYGQNQRY